MRLDAKKCFVVAAEKLLEKSPIKYSIARLLSCLDPRCIVAADGVKSEANFKQVLHKLSDMRHVTEQECDILCKEFSSFVTSHILQDMVSFKNFSIIDERLDSFYSEKMHGRKEYASLYELVKKLLILSHGQATVERGFSVNGQVIVENLKESSVEKQRIVYDAIYHAGDVTKIEITNSLLSYARGARQKYRQYVEEIKAKSAVSLKSDESEKKRKSDEKFEREQTKKRKLLTADIETIEKAARELAKEAELKRDFSLIMQSNALFQKAEEKKVELKELGK